MWLVSEKLPVETTKVKIIKTYVKDIRRHPTQNTPVFKSLFDLFMYVFVNYLIYRSDTNRNIFFSQYDFLNFRYWTSF